MRQTRGKTSDLLSASRHVNIVFVLLQASCSFLFESLRNGNASQTRGTDTQKKGKIRRDRSQERHTAREMKGKETRMKRDLATDDKR